MLVKSFIVTMCRTLDWVGREQVPPVFQPNFMAWWLLKEVSGQPWSKNPEQGQAGAFCASPSPYWRHRSTEEHDSPELSNTPSCSKPWKLFQEIGNPLHIPQNSYTPISTQSTSHMQTQGLHTPYVS